MDTGASYSIFPHSSSDPATGPLLKGPGGQSIACWDEKQVAVVFSGRRFQWLFLLAQVDFAILGADFLKTLWPGGGSCGRLTPGHSHAAMFPGGRDAS